jgi:hypothetical protein
MECATTFHCVMVFVGAARGNSGGKPKPSNPPAEKSKGNAGKSANEITLVAEHQGGEGAKQGKNSRCGV